MEDTERPRGKGLAARNNPLGQRIPSNQVGPDESTVQGQSAELVEEVRKRARQLEGEEADSPEHSTSKEYDPAGPDRQPGKVVHQSNLGTGPRQNQQGQYTQDNEEEEPKV